MQTNLTLDVEFWKRVDPCRTDGCAIWVGGRSAEYGRFYTGDGRFMLAHHYLVGKPPAGLVWDHVRARGCTNKTCVWPGHLEAVTPGENMRRMGPHRRSWL